MTAEFLPLRLLNGYTQGLRNGCLHAGAKFAVSDMPPSKSEDRKMLRKVPISPKPEYRGH